MGIEKTVWEMLRIKESKWDYQKPLKIQCEIYTMS